MQSILMRSTGAYLEYEFLIVDRVDEKNTLWMKVNIKNQLHDIILALDVTAI